MKALESTDYCLDLEGDHKSRQYVLDDDGQHVYGVWLHPDRWPEPDVVVEKPLSHFSCRSVVAIPQPFPLLVKASELTRFANGLKRHSSEDFITTRDIRGSYSCLAKPIVINRNTIR